jgi:hypothetical protein
VLEAFLGAVPAVLIALFSGGLKEGILVALFLYLMQWFEGVALVPRIMGSSAGVHPLLVLFATLRETLLFERCQRVPALEVVADDAPGVAAFGGETAGFQGCSGGEG